MSTKKADLVIPEVLADSVQGEMRGMKVLAGSGAVVMNDTMPSSQGGEKIEVPYFGSIGELERLARNEGGTGPTPALTPRKLTMSGDESFVEHAGIAFEMTQWSQMAAMYADPYGEAARQMREAAERDADLALVEAALNTNLKLEVFSASTPRNLDYDLMVDARQKWGDEDKNIALAAVHSKVMSDFRKQKDSDGRPLLTEPLSGEVSRVAGVPIIVSDRCPVSFPSVTAAGTTPPAVTVTGESKAGISGLRIEITTGGTLGAAVFKYSTDGGNEWIENVATAATVALKSYGTDGTDGVATGLTVNFPAGTYNVNNTYTGVAKFSSLLVRRNALVFWRNGVPNVDTDKDILADSKVAAIHTYYIAHRYKRVPGGTRTGVVRIDHN